MRVAALHPQFQFHKGTIRTSARESINLHNSYFNSIKVRLEHVLGSIPVPFHDNFNSIKVRLEHDTDIGVLPLLCYFNSIKVRLELDKQAHSDDEDGYFNSIKVRLEPDAFLLFQKELSRFQFHKGTIRTRIEFFTF